VDRPRCIGCQYKSRRFSLAGSLARVFFLGPSLLIPPCLIVGLGAPRRKYHPRSLEVFAGLLKRLCSAAALLAGIGAGIEAALPLPTFNRIGLAVAACDIADMDVAVEDVPAIGALVAAAAGENGHRTSLSALERLSISKSIVISS